MYRQTDTIDRETLKKRINISLRDEAKEGL